MPARVGITIPSEELCAGNLWWRPLAARAGVDCSRTIALINGHRRAVLFGLRMLVILLLLAAMLRPTLVRTHDNSPVGHASGAAGSLAQHVGCRTKRVRRLVGSDVPSHRSRLARHAQIGQGFEIKVYTFDSEAHEVDNSKEKLELEREPEGHQTAIGWVIDKVVREEAGKRLAGVILLETAPQQASPPRDRSPQDAVPPTRGSRRPVVRRSRVGQARGLGQSSDIALDQLRANQQVFVKNRFSIAAEARVDGFANRGIPIQMLF